MKAILNNKIVRKALFAAEKPRRKELLGRVTPHLVGGKRVVDIGCGLCCVAEDLGQSGFQVTPVDVRDISIVPEICPVVYDGQKLPFKNKQFDYALILTVLHHVKDQEPLLREAARVAKRLVIVEDVYDQWAQRVATYVMDSVVNLEFFGHPHSNRTDKQWKSLFRKHKLRVEHSSTVPFWNIFRSALYVVQS